MSSFYRRVQTSVPAFFGLTTVNFGGLSTFIGGGGKWNLVSTNAKATSVWTPFWDVIDQNNPNKKIWGVNYTKTGNQYLCNEDDDNYINNFYSALEEIYNFTIKKNDSAFANCFKNAMTT